MAMAIVSLLYIHCQETYISLILIKIHVQLESVDHTTFCVVPVVIDKVDNELPR